MKMRMTFVSALFALQAVMPVAAVAEVTEKLHSRNFAFKYEADTLPQNADPAWKFIKSGSAWTTNIVDGVLSVTSSEKNQVVYWKLETPWTNAVSYEKGFTVEIRYKVDSVLDGINYAFYLRMGDMEGNNTGDIFFSTNRIDVNKFVPALNNVGGDNTGTFHTLRVAKEPDSVYFSLWKDDVFIGRRHNPTLSAANAPLMFCDWTSSSGGVFHFDYVRWDFDGAYAPDPHSKATVISVE